MANSIHVQLAAAVVSELNNTTRTWHDPVQLFTAKQSWKPWYTTKEEIEALEKGPLVAVVAMDLKHTRLARGGKARWDFGITIDIQRHFDVSSVNLTDEVNALDKIAQDIQDFFLDGHDLTGMDDYPVLAADREDVYSMAQFYADGNWETLIALGIAGHR